MKDVVLMLDAASKLLIEAHQSTGSTDIADILDMISSYREQYVSDNGQFGVGS